MHVPDHSFLYLQYRRFWMDIEVIVGWGCWRDTLVIGAHYLVALMALLSVDRDHLHAE